MKKNVYLISSMLLALLCFWSCDKEDGLDPSAMLQMYGRQYNVTDGVIWENNPTSIYSTKPYVYTDIYVNESGETVTDNVEGFTIGDGQVKLGDFMLSLYEEGLVFNENLQAVKGRGACVCFHLLSSDLESLVPGKYVYGRQKANTFIGYSSSDYNTEESVVPAEISEGEVTIEKTGEIYSVVFHCKTTFGGELSGEYRGELRTCRVPLLASTVIQDMSLAGLMDTVTVIETIFGDSSETKGLDVDNGAAFLASSKGICQIASDNGKELVDVALVWDKESESFYFESPIRMRSLLGHTDTYNFPCHTIYMKAPDTFTDDDYDKLEETGFSFTIQDEKVEFSMPSFKPGYVFFEAGNSTQGVIRVKGYTPQGVSITDVVPGIWTRTTPVNPALRVDIKCPANFVNPRIR